MAEHAISKMRVSVIFETTAIVPAGSPEAWNLPYLNLVVLGETDLSPAALLICLKKVESALGRDLNAPRWAPRTIDLDILAWDQRLIFDEGLTVPHQELIHRPFLMGLMASLDSEWRYPVPGHAYSHRSLIEILHRHIENNSLIKCFSPAPQMVGIVNVTPDSFSDGGCYFNAKTASERIQELASQGASVIDIGAQSTRPRAECLTPAEEWRRLEPVFDFLARNFALRPSKPYISLDSYNLEVIQKAFQYYPLDWVNDVQGGKDPYLLELVAEKGCKIVINHSLSIPPSSETILPFNTRPIQRIYDWAQSKIERLSLYGIPRDKIIVDPGIGFGKSMFQSFSLLREIGGLKELGCEILVGHSRKSFLKLLSTKCSSERDIETVGISHYLCKQGVDYLRVHNVEAHQRSLSAFFAIESLYDP
jgi:2-amino-4-hydroxy-6-hydroxymethyldihydropteridine diphosphokinase/dihydropteroate synthase